MIVVRIGDVASQARRRSLVDARRRHGGRRATTNCGAIWQRCCRRHRAIRERAAPATCRRRSHSVGRGASFPAFFARRSTATTTIAATRWSRRSPTSEDARSGPIRSRMPRPISNELRRKRQFSLMRRYGEAVLAVGRHRFHGQTAVCAGADRAGQFADAVRVLKRIVKEADATRSRVVRGARTARAGLQAAVRERAKATGAPGSGWRRAIESYQSVYDEDPEQIWHGINAASLLLRASRDGHRRADPRRRPRDGEGDPRDAGAPRSKAVAAGTGARGVRLRHQGRGVRRARTTSPTPAARWTCTSRTRRCMRSKCPRRIASSTRCCSCDERPGGTRVWWSVCGRRWSAIAPAARRSVRTRRRPRAKPRGERAVRCSLRVSDPGWKPGASARPRRFRFAWAPCCRSPARRRRSGP